MHTHPPPRVPPAQTGARLTRSSVDFCSCSAILRPATSCFASSASCAFRYTAPSPASPSTDPGRAACDPGRCCPPKTPNTSKGARMLSCLGSASAAASHIEGVRIVACQQVYAPGVTSQGVLKSSYMLWNEGLSRGLKEKQRRSICSTRGGNPCGTSGTSPFITCHQHPVTSETLGGCAPSKRDTNLSDDWSHLVSFPRLDSRQHLQKRACKAPCIRLVGDATELLGVKGLGGHVVEGSLSELDSPQHQPNGPTDASRGKVTCTFEGIWTPMFP
eukprot:2323471-Rhodomonas_salina.1